MTLDTIVFYLVSTICVGGAIGVVLARNVVHATLLLLVSLIGVSALYILLLAEFLALVQVLIYGGAITIVVLFVIMLTRVQEFRSMTDNPQKPIAAIVAFCTFLVLTTAMISGNSTSGDGASLTSLEFSTLSNSLFTKWAVPFEVASLVLLVALIGAIVIAREKEKE